MHLTQLRYQDAATCTYLGSPSLVRLPNGDLLATHDYFGPGCPRNHEAEEHLTSVYRSADDGATWINVTHIANAYWGSLFVHRGSVYHLGTSQQYGSIVIRRSDDNGNTWSHPADETGGLLFRGGSMRVAPNYHCAPVPVVEHNGRLYRAFEDCDPCVWGSGFRALVISAPIDADLLQASSWTMSNKLSFDPAWVPAAWGEVPVPGWLEGNVAVAPNGEVWNILRVNSKPAVDKGAIVKVSTDGHHVSFDPATGFIDFPGGMSKFTIRYDAVSGHYFTLSNNNTVPSAPNQRNVLSLYASPDLLHWTHRCTLLTDDSPLAESDSLRLTGFQYVDWQFDGPNLLYLVRTAYEGAHNYHDSNRITFHRLRDFRALSFAGG
ncbi:MAG: sialidase family protein [Caldilineaceae bacterium]